MHQDTIPPPVPGVPAARRFDAGKVRVTDRDIAGLVVCAEMYGAPYDLLAAYLDVREDRLRGIVSRWRAAEYAETGRLGPGPAWCWLTRAGLAALGLRYGWRHRQARAGRYGRRAGVPGLPARQPPRWTCGRTWASGWRSGTAG